MKYAAAPVIAIALLAMSFAFVNSPQKQIMTAEGSTSISKENEPVIGMRSNNDPALRLPLVQPKIVVTKSKRHLALYSNGSVVRVYRVGLGFSPSGDKMQQGDGRTPEGEFYVCVKNANSRYYLSLGLSYPNKSHAERGLADGLITRAQFNEIARAIDRKARPRWDTRLGGEIFIHGHGSSSDWTLGCVALDNEDMKELFDAVPNGTPVVIEP
jgi:murein L,D-transpeptidase YafK